MASRPGTLELIAIALGRVLTRLPAGLGDEELQDTLTTLGLPLPDALLARPEVTAARDALVASAAALPLSIDQVIAAAEAEDIPALLQHGAALLNSASALIAAFDTLPASIDSVRSGFPEVTDGAFAGFAEGFARKLLDLVVADTLDEIPGVGSGLALAGLLDRVRPFEGTDVDLIDVERTAVRYERIPRLVGSPADHFREVYDWGSPEFDGTRLFPVVADLLGRLGAPAAYHPPAGTDPAMLEAYVVDVRPNRSIDPPGMDLRVVSPFGGNIDATLPISGPEWTGTFTARGAIQTALTCMIRPPLTVSVSSPAVDAEASVEVELAGEGTPPFVLLGTAGGSRVEVKAIRLAARAAVSTAAGAAGVDPVLEGELEGGRLLVEPSDGDGFLQAVLSRLQIDAGFGAGLSWSVAGGLRFDGSASLAILLPVHKDLGPFTVHEVLLVAALDGTSIPIEVSASLSCRLGPLDAAINRIGFVATAAFPEGGGNAGPAQVDFAFKPPTGVGLAIGAHGIKGGGFLDIDRPNSRYVGMLHLQFHDRIDLTAIGIINTLPDSFSLLILISAEFQPIQLGLGFTLNGVGGLLALNRTVDVEHVRAGLRGSTLESLLFPQDPIENANRIISDLSAIFPIDQGQFVIGPMAKIAYGTPALVTIDLALLIELPNPIRIAVAGVLRALLPEEGEPLIELRVNFLGTIDFGRGELAFDASIYDSRLLAFDLSGDMAVRVRWVGRKLFLQTVGGFHPAFQPPPLNLPPLRRLVVQLLDGDNPRLRLETYYAITSNTVQFGARVELYAAAGKFNAYGFLGFDVLFQFLPFRFVADVRAMVALRVGSRTIASVSLELTLEGPAPWKAKGSASLKLFWFLTVRVRFSATWGDPLGILFPFIEVLPAVIAALSNPSNWSSLVPAGRHLLVSLRAAPPGTGAILVHPLGGLSIGQKVVPLGVPITTFGNRKPSDHTLFAITGVRAGGSPLSDDDVGAVQEHFAPAQFFEKSDAEKLSAESFVEYPAGVTLGESSALASSASVPREVDFELRYRDSHRGTASPPFRGTHRLDGLAFHAWAQNGAVARSPLSFAGARRPELAPEPIVVAQERYAVAHLADLRLADGGTEASSEVEAFVMLARLVRERPELAGKLQVVPAYEVNREVA